MKSNTIFVEDTIAIDCLDFCSLSFLSLALHEKKEGDILFYSSQNYLLVKSELNHLKIYTKIYKDYQERVTFHFLKKPISRCEKTFFKEFETGVKDFSGKLIYFDRIDYFLDHKSLVAYEKSLKKINSIVQKYGKKIIYIYNSQSSKNSFLDNAMKKNMTTLDFMNRDKRNTKMPSLDALQDKLLHERPAVMEHRESNIQVMLMSDNDELKKLHYYIFSSSEDVDYYTIDILPEEEMSILEEMDIIIYNKKDPLLKKQILSTIKHNRLPVKFFEITNNAYLRQKDLLIANLDGVDKLFKKDFLMEDFVMSIEMYLKSNFYSKRLLTLDENNEIIIYKKELFEKKIESLLDKKVFFSLFTYAYDADAEIESYNIQKIVREYDNIFVNKRKKELQFLILNTVPDFGKELIQKRIQNFSISLELLESKSAFDLIFD